MKITLLIIFLCNLLIAGNIQKLHTKTEIKGIDSQYVTQASNGNLYIKNARIYTDKLNNDGQISIKTGKNIKKVIVSNVKITSRNISTRTDKEVNAILAISSNKETNIAIENLDIDSHNVKLITKNQGTNVCSSALCIQSENNAIHLQNINIHSSSLTASVESRGDGSKCAGAVCVQSNNSMVDIANVHLLDTGKISYSVKN